MSYLWLFGSVIVALVVSFYLYLFYLSLKMFRSSEASVPWQQWVGLATGFAASVLLLLDHINAVRHHIYSSTSDFRFLAIVLMLCSLLLIRKVVVRRRA
jgi:hypothetical protein